jgi:hypothetical protein
MKTGTTPRNLLFSCGFLNLQKIFPTESTAENEHKPAPNFHATNPQIIPLKIPQEIPHKTYLYK